MFEDLSTIIGTKVATSIEINGLWIPANSIASVLGRFVEPATFISPEFSPYDLSISGSFTKVKMNNRFFGLATEHQRGDLQRQYSYEQLGLLNLTTQTLTTSHFVFYGKSEAWDCTIYEFTDGVRSGSLSATGWYNVSQDLGATIRAEKALAIGFPGDRNSIDYLQSRYRAQPMAVWADPSEPSMKDRLSMVPNPEIDFEPSGMSGGGVFGISLASGQPKIFLAGLLANASTRVFNFIPVSTIARLRTH
ncbi:MULTISPECIES: hypothetical protein [unclassified Marinovum]